MYDFNGVCFLCRFLYVVLDIVLDYVLYDIWECILDYVPYYFDSFFCYWFCKKFFFVNFFVLRRRVSNPHFPNPNSKVLFIYERKSSNTYNKKTKKIRSECAHPQRGVISGHYLRTISKEIYRKLSRKE